MAPELFLQKGRGRRSDIWSLGCTLIELLTGQNPWPEANKVQQVYDNVLNNRIPKLPDNISQEASDFITDCLKFNKNDRPYAD